MTLTGPSTAVSAGGESATVAVGAAPECAWSASTAATWISELAPTGGQGAASIQFKVASNLAPVTRQADIVVNDVVVHVSQVAAACRFEVSPLSVTIAAGGGTGSVAVTTMAGCAWSAASQDSWITITSNKDNDGSGTVAFTLPPNTDAARTSALTIAGQRVVVAQEAGNCRYVLAPLTHTVGAAGGTGTSSVTAPTGCAWTAVPDVPWISISGVTSGTASGVINFAVTQNTGAARTGHIGVGSQVMSIVQDSSAAPPPSSPSPSCSYSISPVGQAIGSQGGAGSVSVSAAAGCGWSATSSATWLVVSGGSSGSGSGSVSFTVSANTGAARSASLSIAGQNFTVSQAAAVTAGCSYGVTPLSQSVGALGGSGLPISVTTTGQCDWTSATNDSWIQVTSGSSGHGGGTVQLAISPNLGAARNGSISVAGQIVAVAQGPVLSACSYALNPSSESVSNAAGTGRSIAVTTSALCGWTAASNSSWITIDSGSVGLGSGSVGWHYAQNTGPQRTGTISIGNQTFTVTQAQSCSYTISPTSQSVRDTGGSNSVSVSANAGCAWTASTQTTWLTITAGASGSGNGTLTYSVAPNATKKSRSGTISIAGQTLTVDQAK